ncbi:TonB-dependent receptor [Rhodohalobacter halophilus]|uniref:TonB-dependent receptor n=1 Tax=Rhodohalobacter halophilus TaxID=1812810 RepID=UPI0009FF7B5B|nr:TonB-dependent receptor [Rhodohalobacter halophilus]
MPKNYLLLTGSFLTILLSIFLSETSRSESVAYGQHSASEMIIEVVDHKTGLPIASVMYSLVNIRTGELITEGTGSEDGVIIIDAQNLDQTRLILTHRNYMRNEVNLGNSGGDGIQIVTMKKAYSIQIEGVVKDGITGKRVRDVQLEIFSNDSDIVVGNPIGTVTNRDGHFRFTFNYSLPFQIRFSHVAYFPAERNFDSDNISNIEVSMTPRMFQEEDIVVTADMMTRDELQSTQTISRVSSVDVQQVASFDAFDLISTLREVDVATQSMNMQTISTRGFNTGASSRVLQLTDGIDSQAPGLGFPVGNLLGPSDLDIANMEMVLGPASSLHGPGAMGGVLNINSKNPFQSPGFSAQVKGGVNDLRLGGGSQWAAEGDGMFDFSGRYAESFGDRLALKITGSWLMGTDWQANNYKNIGYGEPWETHRDVHGYNGVNVYGDESFTYLPVAVDRDGVPDGSYLPVTRNGYNENELVDYDVETRKAAGSIHFKPTHSSEFKLEGRYGYTNTLYTDDSRIRLEGFEIFQLTTELRSEYLYTRAYTTWQQSGDSYDVVKMADQLLESAKSDQDWFRDYRLAYQRGIPFMGIPRGDRIAARNFANSGVTLIQDQTARPFLEPGSEEFASEFKRLKKSHDFDDGAGIRDNSELSHVEAGFKSKDRFDSLELNGAISFRYYELNSGGTLFPDTTGNEITNFEYGAYLQSVKKLSDENLVLSAAIRADKNENFRTAVSPQLGINYLLADKHYLLFSYQYGFRFPTVREQFLNQDIGNARILGGLSQIVSPYQLEFNSVTEQSLEEFNEIVINELNKSDVERSLAELIHLNTLENGIIGEGFFNGIKPEKTHSIEIGYRRLYSSNFYLDLNYFVNFYDQFIGLHRVVKPRTSPSIDLYAAAGQLNSAAESDRFYVYGNATDWVTIHGVSFDLKQQSGTFFFGLNGTLTEMINNSDDPLVPGFNTPPLKFNVEWGNREIAPNIGFKMIYRHRAAHNWRSPFLDGRLEQYGHFDFQLNVGIPALNSLIKAGFTNMGVRRYTNMFGGPAIGSIVFATFTYNPGIF